MATAPLRRRHQHTPVRAAPAGWNPLEGIANAIKGASGGASSPPSPLAPPAEEEVEEKSDEYTAEMQSRMGTSLTYRCVG